MDKVLDLFKDKLAIRGTPFLVLPLATISHKHRRGVPSSQPSLQQIASPQQLSVVPPQIVSPQQVPATPQPAYPIPIQVTPQQPQQPQQSQQPQQAQQFLPLPQNIVITQPSAAQARPNIVVAPYPYQQTKQ